MLRALLLAAAACAPLIVLPAPASAADKNCSDFANQAAALAWLNAYPGDPDGLDGDNDGAPCESLPCPCGAATTTTPPPAVAPDPSPPAPPAAAQAPAQTAAKVLSVAARVTSVIDGDTLKVRFDDGRKTTVRLVGIDTPETKKPGTPVQCGGRAATARMKQLAFRNGRGRAVTITTDPTQGLTDRYDRLLSYVSAGGTDFGRAMVSSGWAKTYVYKVDFQRVDRYRSAQKVARTAKRGVHRRCAGNFHRN